MLYSIVDIETTGGSSGNRITEIAICKTDGGRIIETYETLINPETYISRSISMLTGISNSMVESAPLFEHQAEDLMSFLDGTIFVAHNVSFDYSIIKNHFQDIGIQFNMKKLCTVRLSRGIFQQLPSYSLGKLCSTLGIENEQRHRAMGDAKATTHLFHLLLEKDENNFLHYSLNQLNRETVIPPNLLREEFDELPEKAGVYYFLNADQKILYVGKAKNVKKRVSTHFLEKSRKKSELLRRLHHVTCVETGNELIALLLESDEIKRHYPPYNKAQKSKAAAYHVSYYTGQDGVMRVDIFNQPYGGISIASFTSVVMARDYLYQLVDTHGLCPRYCSLEKGVEKCSKGDSCYICAGDMDHHDYNKMVKSIKDANNQTDFLIVGPGRTDEEKSAVFIKNGTYQGFGFFEEEFVNDPLEIIESIQAKKANADTQRILDQFIRTNRNKQYEIVELPSKEATLPH